jgi:hypothetical protein
MREDRVRIPGEQHGVEQHGHSVGLEDALRRASSA